VKRGGKKFTLLVCSFLAFSNISYAQTGDISKLLEANAKYFSHLRENVHLHLNKTTFIKGEHIWYTAYVYDQNRQLPSVTTSNLYVALVDTKGIEITKQLIHIENGIGQGDLLVDSNLLDSSYFIIAWTEWMKNFEDLQPFVQKIKLLNTERDSGGTGESQPNVEITPEGGRILTGAQNTIGFQIENLLSSQNAISYIELINAEGAVVVDNLTVDETGAGKVRYFQEPNETNSLRIFLKDGLILNKPLPIATEKGIKMEVSSNNPSFVYITITADSSSLKKEKKKPLYLAIRQNDKINVTEHFLNSQSSLIKVLKSSLYEGINMVTLFNSDLKPLSERIIFNDASRNLPNDYVRIHGGRSSDGDSLQLILEAGDQLDSSLTVSVSVLPFNSIAYDPHNNLISSFKLRPYGDNLEGNSLLHKNKLDRKNLYNLDISLLNNGSGRYPWTTIVADEHDLSFAFENNIPFKGRILDADPSKENKVWFFSVKSNNGFYTDLNSDKTFSGNEIFFSGDSLRISVFGEKEKLRKPKAEIEFLSLFYEDSIWYKKFMALRSMNPVTINTNFIDKSYSLGNKLPDSSKTIVLDEVVVTDRIADPRDISINSAFDSGKRITDQDIRQSVIVVNYLRKLGYKIEIYDGEVSVLSRTIPPGAFGYVPVPVTIGGMLIDGRELLSMPLHRVQSVFYDNMGYRYISFSPYPGHYIQKNKKQYLSLPITNGFTIPGEYFDPGYSDLRSNEFIRYGVVSWLPEVTLNKYESAKIKIPTLNQKSFLIYIEGMSSDGILISKEEILDFGKNKIGN
jgi:hypothetical protein